MTVLGMNGSALAAASSPSNEPPLTMITAKDLKECTCTKTFSEGEHRINSIDFSSDGKRLITSSNDESIVLYDCDTGTKSRSLNSKKYGVDLIKFTHSDQNGLHCSTKVDDSIRYLSLHDNKYLRYFQGHTKKVLSLSLSPADDMFLSASEDKTIRLWDLRTPNCQGVMNVTSRAICAFDPDGLIFGAGINNNCVKLYDLRSFDKGPFVSWAFEAEPHCDWTGMKFAPDGKNILITTNGDILKIVDAFTGSLRHILKGHVNSAHLPLEATFTPDSAFVLSGSSNGLIHCWSTETGEHLFTKETLHEGVIQQIAFNPKFYILAAACNKLTLWIPHEGMKPSLRDDAPRLLHAM